MKIAVLYSGQIRGDSYKDNIWHMKTILPEADFYFSTWKGDVEYSFIDHYFDEPHIPYNSEKQLHQLYLKKLRELKEEHGYVPEDASARSVLKCRSRKMGRDRVKQHVAHALAYEKFVYGKDYDIVIRIRYDLEYEKEFDSEALQYLISLCINENKPVGIGYLGTGGDHGIPLREVSLVPRAEMIGDVFIIHKADMFDHTHVYELIENKKLRSAEFGWHQILCQPYATNCWTANQMYAWIAPSEAWIKEQEEKCARRLK